MKEMQKRVSAIILVVVLLVTLCPTISAASGAPTYNYGTRDEICIELSDYAQSYYTSVYAFDTLSQQTGKQLLNSLYTLMKSTHSYQSSYDDCRDMAVRTDCEDGMGVNGQITMLYSSYQGNKSEYYSGSGWNREHVWPKSLGGFGTKGAGADLHHIRPAESRINSTRNNNLYGNVSSNSFSKGNLSGLQGGEYDSAYYEPLDNVKGDVARICLYVYVRYGSEISQCSNITTVFQSVDVLLEWCALDPVDEWEMGRNDVVEGIQGNRNVFIDYPEYAWLIFDKDVPTDMVTPSGEAKEMPPSSVTPPDRPSQEETTTKPETTVTEPEFDPVEPEAGTKITVSKSMSDLIAKNDWDNNTTKQSFMLDGAVSVAIDGGMNSGKAYNGDHIRIYATDSPAGTMKISVKDGYELNSIKISTVTGAYALLCVNGTNTDIGNTTTAVSGSSVLLNTVKNGANGKQVRITGIEVTYTALGTDAPEVTTTEPETIVTEPQTTVTEPETTVTEPEVTVTEPDTTVAEPETTVTEPDTTVIEPDTTVAEPETTVTEPETTVTEPETLVTVPVESETNQPQEEATTAQDSIEETTAAPSGNETCEHTYGDWQDMGDAGSTRTCSKCGAVEFASKKNTNASDDAGCGSTVIGVGSATACVAILSVAFMVKKKKFDEEEQ